jgi:hypothetical protein
MLNESPYFASPQTLPAWKVAWHFWDAAELDFNEAVYKVEEDFKTRKFTIMGEIFHVFGLRLLFADIGIIEKSRSDVTNECMVYIHDLCEMGALPDSLQTDRERWTTGWEGLGFYDSESSEFKQLTKYMDDIQHRALLDSLPDKGNGLLDLMEGDTTKVLRKLCLNNFSASEFYNIPILAAIPPETFVDRVLRLDPSSQSSIFSMFVGRYETGALEGPLKDEKNWLIAVRQEFEKRMGTMSAVARYRLKQRTQHSFAKFLPPERAVPVVQDPKGGPIRRA